MLCIGISARHLEQEHLKLDDSHKSVVFKNHLWLCHQCCNWAYNDTFYKILRKCHTNYVDKCKKCRWQLDISLEQNF